MGEHDTWFHLLPGVRNLDAAISQSLGHGILGSSSDHSPHVIMSLGVTALLVFLAISYRAQRDATPDGGAIPDRRLSIRSFVELIAEQAYGLCEGIMGRTAARYFLPLIGTLAFFILLSNLAGLVPGFLPPTDQLSTVFPAALVVFFATHIYGVKRNGVRAYFGHMMGPMRVLAPLIFLIELISHLARPLSLSLRLFGNMVGDHKVLLVFMSLAPLLVPIPVMVLGIIVCVVQTLVFCLLSVVYIGMAIEDMHAHH